MTIKGGEAIGFATTTAELAGLAARRGFHSHGVSGGVVMSIEADRSAGVGERDGLGRPRLVGRALALLSFRGRLSRVAFWRAYLLLMAVGSLTLIVGYSAMILAGPFAAVLLLPMLPVVVGNAAIVVRRLHDRGKSGWWGVFYFVLPSLAGAGAQTLTAPPAVYVAALIALGALGLEVWGTIEVGFRRGVAGRNRYGPDPGQPTEAEVFA